MSNRANAANWRKDATLAFSGGQDASRNPSAIDRDQVARAVNCTFRGDVAAPRPRYIKRPLTFATNVQVPFETSYFQHGSFYNGGGVSSSVPSLISSHGGRIFKIDLKTFAVSDVTPIKNATTTTTANFTIPAAGSTVAVSVSSTANMFSELTSVNIAGYSFTLISVDSLTQITVKNLLASQAAITVNSPATVTYQVYDANDPTQPLGWSEQAENYWIYQDNQSYPIIFNGSASRRSDPKSKEVPVGNVMCYTAGRLAVALPDRQSFRVGDIFGGASTQNGDPRTAILKFTENDYLNEGGDFVARIYGAPSNSGPILSMKACAMTDAQLGQGPMIVGTPNVVFTVNLPFDRTTWKNLSNALQTANPIIGPCGQDSTVLINTDLWYRSLDGIRSYIMAQRQFNTYGNTPMSAELGDLLDYDTTFLLEQGSAVLFDNRMIMTVSPVQSPNGVWHRGFVALDFNLVSTIRKKTAPAWEGVWTGLRALKIVKGLVDQVERCFIYALSATNTIELWELVTSVKTDNEGTPIQWGFDLPSYNCGDSDNFKRLETGRVVLENVSGTLNCVVQYRSDLGPCWQDWTQFNVCSKNEDCGPYDCAGPHTYKDQKRAPVKLAMPPDAFDPNFPGQNFRTGFEFQPRFNFTGYGEVRSFRMYCLDATESINTERTAT